MRYKLGYVAPCHEVEDFIRDDNNGFVIMEEGSQKLFSTWMYSKEEALAKIKDLNERSAIRANTPDISDPDVLALVAKEDFWPLPQYMNHEEPDGTKIPNPGRRMTRLLKACEAVGRQRAEALGLC